MLPPLIAYSGHRAVLATKHDKGAIVAPPLRDGVGAEVVTVEVDTDVLGTFTGDVPRPGPPEEVVVTKARLGADRAASRLALGSEGSIHPHPHAPFLTVDRELVVLVAGSRTSWWWAGTRLAMSWRRRTSWPRGRPR